MDRLKIYPNERLGLPDAEDALGGKLVLDENIRRGEVLWLPTGRTTGQAAASARIFGGFDFASSPVGNATATLNAGTGIFPYLDGSDLKFGVLNGEQDPASQILDYSSEPDDTYAVYVRAVYNPAEVQNRVFWNPSGSPAAEYVDNISTRDVATWEVISQDADASPPGNGEWVKIYEITVVSNLITAVTEFRHFFFEGSAHATDAYAQEWGDGANDRSNDRTLAPITDMHRFVQFVRRQFSDMIDGANHWKDPLKRHATALHVAGNAQHSAAPTNARNLVVDASGLTYPVSIEQNLFTVVDGWGRRCYAWETSGRLARPPRFFDDFTQYGSAWADHTTEPYGYTATRTNTGDVFIALSTAQQAENGCVRLTCNGGDTADLVGPYPGFFVDPAKGRWRFAARAKVDWGTIGATIFRIGLTSAAWGLYFDVDPATYGDNDWRIAGTDAALPVNTSFGVDDTGPPTNWFLFYLWVVDATTIGWAIHIEDAPTYEAKGTITVASLTGNANSLQCLAVVQSSSGISTMNIDWWEMWGDKASGMGINVLP